MTNRAEIDALNSEPAKGTGQDVMGFTDEDQETAVFMALGAASTCWDENGVFLSRRASQIGHDLVAHLRRLRLIPEARVRP